MNLFWHNRKVILSFFLLLMCLIVGGCSERTGAKEETDALVPLNSQQIEYSSLYGQIMAEGDKGYYMLAGNFVFFAERDLSKAVPLCNKPNCRHYEETDTQKLLECNAFFNRAVSVGWQDGKLYVVADNITSEGKIEGNVLMSVSPDGEGRKKLLQYDDTTLGIVLHQGYVYGVQKYYNEAGEETCQIERRSLKDLNKREVIYSCVLKDAEIQDLECVENRAYFLEYSASECIYRAMELDLDTIEAKRILTEDDGVSPQFNITREYIYCNFFPFMNGKENSIYYRYVQGEKEAELFVEGDEENLTQRMIPDERYYYMQDLFWKMERMPEDGYKLQVFDAEEKKEITEIPFYENMTILPGNTKYLFGYHNGDMVTYYYADKSEFSGNTAEFHKIIQIPWKKACPALIIQGGE